MPLSIVDGFRNIIALVNTFVIRAVLYIYIYKIVIIESDTEKL